MRANHYNRTFDLFNDRNWRGHSYVGLSVKCLTQSLQTTSETLGCAYNSKWNQKPCDLRNEKIKEQQRANPLGGTPRNTYCGENMN